MESFDMESQTGADLYFVKYLKKPTVRVKILSSVLSIIVFGCILSEGWRFDHSKKAEVCIIHNSYSTCQLGTTIPILSFTMALLILCGEYYYDQLPSLETKKQFVFSDFIFSGLFAFLFLISFSSLAHQWGLSPEPRGHVGHSNISAAIAFSFFSILSWSVSAGLAYRRLQSGVDTDLETSLLGADQVSGSYSGGAVGGYQDIGGYNEAVAETGQYRQQQSPFTQISDS